MEQALKKHVKRLGIFACSDEKEGKIDRYIFYLLNDIKENLDDLIVVVNGKLQPESRWKLSEVTPYVVTREDKGLDPAAYRFAMIDYFGWDKVQEYDEIVMFNDTFFGPFYPFKEVFDEMDQKDCDFWGLTPHYKAIDPTGLNPYGYFPEHIELYFLVVRKRMHTSYEFMNYWENMKILDNYFAVIATHETYFTKFFHDQGFTYDVYCDASETKNRGNRANYNPYYYEADWLMEHKRFPVYKRKNLKLPLSQAFDFSYGNEQFRALEYIKNHTNYDMSMIWENVLRIYSMSDVFYAAGLEYCLSKRFSASLSEKVRSKILVILHITYTDQLDFLCHYLQAIPSGVDVIITTHEEQAEVLCNFAKEYENVKVKVVTNRGRDMSALLIGVREDVEQYDYVCFCHDKKSVQVPRITARDWEDSIWENLLGSEAYIANVIDLFEDNRNLGLLVPPVPAHGDYSIILGQRWTENFENVKKLAKRLKLDVHIESEKQPLTVGGVFWCRREALMKLWKHPFQYTDFSEEPRPDDGELGHSIERILPYVAQDAGYYTGWVMTEREAALEARNMRYMVETMMYHLRFHPEGFPGLSIAGLGDFASKLHRSGGEGQVPEDYYNHLFPYHLFHRGARVALYGAGNIGKQFYRQALQDDYVKIVGIVDKNATKIQSADIPVQPIDELRNMSFDYVLLTMNRPPVMESGKKDILALGIPEEKIKWDGQIYYRDHFYQKYYFRLMDKYNPKRLPYAKLLK